MIVSFGTIWTNEEQTVSLRCSTFMERWCCLRLYCYPGAEHVKSHTKEKKNTFTSCSTFSCPIVWKHWQKDWWVRRDFQTFIIMNLEHIGIFRVYWGSDARRLSSGLKFKSQGCFSIALHRIFLPAVSIAASAGWERGRSSRSGQRPWWLESRFNHYLLLFGPYRKLLNPSEPPL